MLQNIPKSSTSIFNFTNAIARSQSPPYDCTFRRVVAFILPMFSCQFSAHCYTKLRATFNSLLPHIQIPTCSKIVDDREAGSWVFEKQCRLLVAFSGRGRGHPRSIYIFRHWNTLAYERAVASTAVLLPITDIGFSIVVTWCISAQTEDKFSKA